MEMNVNLDMSHVGLGTLDEYSLMVLFGNAHSRCLTDGLAHDPGRITDAKGNILYPAYFMTHLIVPPCVPLGAFGLWGSIDIEASVRRYGDTILDSSYRAGKKGETACITMQANSLFILDPGIYRARRKQGAAPQPGAICELAKLGAPPVAIQEAARVRANGFEGRQSLALEAAPYAYTLELNRDVAPGHPMIFARIPAIAELAERQFLRQVSQGRLSEDILQAVSLLDRKTFYYDNAFAGETLTLHTRGAIRPCGASLWKDNPRLQYTFFITCETELYHGGELIAISRAEKVIVHEIRNQSLIQDTKRILQPLCLEQVQ
jgi:probable biosynthetic protein (TIGR04098 family)